MENNQPKPVVTGYPAAAAQPPHSAPAGGVPAHGAAYPYPAPPPYYAAPPPPPPGPYYSGAAYGGDGGSTNLLRRLIVVAIVIFLLFGLVTFIIWLVLRPRVPVFAVSSASVSSFNVSSGSQQLSADFNLSVSVRNPNKKMGISYDNMEVAILYGSALISETSMPPFFQGKGDSSALQTRLVAVTRYIGANAAGDISRDKSSNGGTVVFYVRIKGRTSFRSGAWRMRMHAIRVFCNNVKISFSNMSSTVGALTGPPQQCDVDI